MNIVIDFGYIQIRISDFILIFIESAFWAGYIC